MKKRIISLVLAILMLAGMVGMFSSCGSSSGENDTFVIMSEELDGLFNPFYSTTAADGTIVSMTQIGMLTSKYVKNADGSNSVVVGFGDEEAVVTKNYEEKYDEAKNETTYTFVLKKGIKFSDGTPLTMEDVLFNLYVYLDPVYTGSNTMYSTAIKGLGSYRNQTISAGSDEEEEARINADAKDRASNRIKELLGIYLSKGQTTSGFSFTEAQMKEAILAHTLSDGYKKAVSNKNPTVNDLLADYEHVLELFREELEDDYTSAQSTYTEKPHSDWEEFQNEVMCFMLFEGYIKIEWEKDPVTNKDDKSKIKKLEFNYPKDTITTKEQAIDYVYNQTVVSKFHEILSGWATAGKLMTEYTAEAKQVILNEGVKEDGSLRVPSIEGIKSLGHTDLKGTTITVNGTEYTIASEHDENGVPTNGYDVLQITIEGKDPKAQWNFAFTVAPQHYYGAGSKVGVDIENNKFGVEFASFDFMKNVIQSVQNIMVPMGAGAYKATDRSNNDSINRSDFFTSKIVYFKANEYFTTVDDGNTADPIKNAKIEKVRYQVISNAKDAIGMLQRGDVHYISPQLTLENSNSLDDLKAGGGFDYVYTDQLGYGYIGINASKVTDINLRKAIMCAMDTSRAVLFYKALTAEQIFWPMSTVSWAYPTNPDGTPDNDTGKAYPQTGKFDRAYAETLITQYMQAAGVSAGDKKLEIEFTIAGSNLTDHPTYNTFRYAAEILNGLGWNITVVPDTNALTKLATGSLTVWAAAWGSTIDPDMYQVYHKNSTATSTKAWGYEYIKNSAPLADKTILNELSALIDQARETTVESERKAIYEQAMSKLLDLAIELPVYQRSVVYAFNTNVIDQSTLPSEINPYSSPLDRIWEIDFVNSAE